MRAWLVCLVALSSGCLTGATPPQASGAVLPAGGAGVYVLNGEDDPATAVWRSELPRWQGEGRNVFFRVLPGLRHEFVFDQESLRDALVKLGFP